MQFYGLIFIFTVFLNLNCAAVDNVSSRRKATKNLLEEVNRKDHPIDVARVDELIAQGADPNAMSSEGGNPVLHTAIFKASKGAVEHLLAAGADPSVQNMYGTKSLNIAGARDAVEVVPCLMAADERLDQVTDVMGSLPLHGAGREMAELLLCLPPMAGLDVNAKTEYGHTPLHVALANHRSITFGHLLLDPRLKLEGELDESKIQGLNFSHLGVGDESMKRQLRVARSILGRPKR